MGTVGVAQFRNNSVSSKYKRFVRQRSMRIFGLICAIYKHTYLPSYLYLQLASQFHWKTRLF